MRGRYVINRKGEGMQEERDADRYYKQANRRTL
jgi:hypothetical protein